MDHLIFNRLKFADKERRKKRGFGPPLSPKNHTSHGKHIEDSVDSNIKSIIEKGKQFNFNPYLVLKIELEEGVTFQEGEEEKLALFGLKIIDKESNQLQVVFSESIDLKIFKEELQAYKDGKIAISKIKNEDLFLKIKTISTWSREDRLAFNFEKIKEGSYLDVYLWVFDTIDLTKRKMDEFKVYVSENKARVCDSYVGQSVAVLRVQVKGEIVEKILEHPLVYKVEDITKISVNSYEIGNIKDTSVDDIEFDISQLDPDKSASICVIDSGIFQQHPLLKGVIGDSRTFYIQDALQDNADDLSGHGTKVASVCAYGDFIYNQKFSPELYLHNAKIHNGEYEDIDFLWKVEVEKEIGQFSYETMDAYLHYQDGTVSFDDLIQTFEEDKQPYLRMVYSKYSNMYEKLIPTQMRQIVDYFYRNYGCRVYNLSQGDSNNVYNNGKPKAWACVLDEIQNELDVLFIISAGNFYYEENNNYENILEEYPKYFSSENGCKIIEPANSVSSITVGAISISEKVYNPYPDRLDKLKISKSNELSSITRIGPGVCNSIKPDFIAYGGDRGLELDFLGRKKPLHNVGLSKLLFKNDNKGLFAWDIGTSFAAPYISHIVGKIVNKYPEASNNLIRAILASSSGFPVELNDLNKVMCTNNCNCREEFKSKGNINLAKMLYYTAGYGYPKIEDCLDSFDNRVVLIADIKNEEEVLSVDNMHVFSIPLPDEFKNAKGKKNVTVSLAFNPKVKNTRIDYMGVALEYKLIKGKTKEEVIQIYESQKGRSETVRINSKYECNTNPVTTIRSKGTLQKAVYEFSQDSNFNNQDLFLIVNSKKGWDESSQKYAVVVVLECKDEELKLYNIVKNRLEQRLEARARV